MLETNIIITNKNRNAYHFWRNVVAAFLVFFVFTVRRYNRNETISDNFAILQITILIVTLVALLWLFILSKKRKRIGRIQMSDSTLVIKMNNETKEFMVGNLMNLKIFRYDEEKKENSALTTLLSNTVSFNFNGINFEYQFEISSNYQENNFKKIVASWIKQGFLHQVEQPAAGLESPK